MKETHKLYFCSTFKETSHPLTSKGVERESTWVILFGFLKWKWLAALWVLSSFCKKRCIFPETHWNSLSQWISVSHQLYEMSKQWPPVFNCPCSTELDRWPVPALLLLSRCCTNCLLLICSLEKWHSWRAQLAFWSQVPYLFFSLILSEP